jgi:hypothetical protein
LEHLTEDRAFEEQAPTGVQPSPAPSAHPQQLAAAVGNRLMASFVQREGNGGQGGGTTGGQEEGGQQRDWAAERQAMETVRGDAQARALSLEAFVGKALGDVQSITENLGMVSQEYSQAYERYAKAVEQGKLAAKKSQEWADIGISLGIGLVLVAAPELGIFELGAEGALSTKLTEVAVHTGAETGVVKSGVLELAGSELKTGGLTPEGQQLDTTKNLMALYQKLLSASRQTGNLQLVGAGAEYAIGEIKAQIGGGAGADMPVDKLVEMIEVLQTADKETASIEDQVKEAETYFTKLQQKALMSKPDPKKMEQDIVIMAMAEMSDSEAPELKSIKEYLNNLGVLSAGQWSGSGGRLGVDLGAIYATPGDTRKAVAAAKAEKDKLKSEYDALAGGGGE